ncbi:MAG: mechanosensitive ion channel domain-containing protein [Kiritimatiellales bacterium]
MEQTTLQNTMSTIEEAARSGSWDKVNEILIQFGLQLLAATLIFIVGRWLARRLQLWIERVMRRAKVDPILITFTANLTYTLMLIVVILAALAQIGIQTASLVAILGAAGLAIGLALQGSLSNFAAGVLMVIFRPFKIGEYIEGGGAAGTVKAIHIFTTTLTSPDNRKIIVPNSKMMSDNIVNYSAHGTRRISLTAVISYRDDIDAAKTILKKLLENEPRVLSDPAPLVAVAAIGDHGVEFTVRGWVNVSDFWGVTFDLTEAIKKSLDAAGLTIPFRQQDVHLYTHNS